jgi:hypothetical protein
LAVNTTHGGYTNGGPYSELTAWKNMHIRCKPGNEIYDEAYAKRGITVCDRWQDFSAFLQDMGKKPSKDHTLDRKDNNKGYFPDNCRWATAKEQSNNTRKNRWITWEGERKTIAQWAEHWNMDYDSLYRKFKSQLKSKI